MLERRRYRPPSTDVNGRYVPQLSEPLRTFAWLIREVGFPVFVALYLLMQMDPALAAVQRTLARVEVLLDRVEQNQDELLNELRRR